MDDFAPTDLGEVFGEEPVIEEAVIEAVAEEAPAEEVVEPEKVEVEEAKVVPAETTVPLSALKAEREQRQELERRLDEMSKPKEEAEKADFFDDPDKALENLRNEMRGESDTKILEALLETTVEMIGEEEFEAKTAIFNEAAAKDNSLLYKVSQSKNPVLAAYKEGKRLEALNEIGDDPIAYKATLKAAALEEARAELRQEAENKTLNKAAQAKAITDTLPVDIANENSSGSRKNGFAGPTSLDDIFG